MSETELVKETDMKLDGGDIGHYSELFLQAMSRVVEVASHGGDYSSQFVYEMRALGWRERMRNLYRIKDKETGQFVFFKPNSFQDRFEEERSGRDIILKCRQVGFTTWSCIYALDRALWDGWNTGIMSHIRERTGMLFAIIKNANDWYKRDWGKYYLPVQEQDSSNGISWVESKASITVSYDFRGLTLRFLHVSEAGFIESDRLIGSMQAVPEAGEIILESTPNGSGGMYYNQWNLWKKEGDLAPFKGYFCAWHQHYPEHPERWINKEIKLNEKELELKELYGLENYHLAWRRWKINESCDGSEEVFDVEYPSDDISCFLSGSDQVFASKTLKLQESFVKDPSFIGVLRSEGKKKVSFYGDKKGVLQVWELPKGGVSYVIGVDTSTGYSKDYCVAVVLNKATGEQVSMLRSHIPVDEWAEHIYNLGHFYNYAWVCPEVNSYGLSVVTDLVKMGYTKVYKRTDYAQGSNSALGKLYGFYTSSTTKPSLIKDLSAGLKDGKFRVRSRVILEELSSFIQVSTKTGRGVKLEARPDCFDDCVIALALSVHMSLQLQDEINDHEIVLPESMHYDEDTGFLVFNEGLERYG